MTMISYRSSSSTLMLVYLLRVIAEYSNGTNLYYIVYGERGTQTC